jgi:hypothetical protein
MEGNWLRPRIFLYNCCNGVQPIDQQESVAFERTSLHNQAKQQRGISSIFSGKVSLQNLAKKTFLDETEREPSTMALMD